MTDDNKSAQQDFSTGTSRFPGFDASLGDFSSLFEDSLLLEKYEAAELHLKSFYKQYGNTPQYFFNLGRLKAAQNDYAAAYEVFKKLHYEQPVFLAPKDEYRRFRNEIVYTPLEKAKAQWAEVLKLIQKHFDDIDSEQGDSGPPSQREFKESVKQEINKIVLVYNEILKVEPFCIDALKGLAVCFTELGQGSLVVKAKDKIEESKHHWSDLSSGRSKVIISEAKKQQEIGKLETSIRIINLGLEEAPANQELLTLKAESLLHLRKYREAYECAQMVSRINPSSNEAKRLKLKIEMMRFEDDLEKAMEKLMEAESKDAGSRPQELRLQEASSLFLDALSHDPANLVALSGLYRCHILAGNPYKAQKALEKIKEIDSKLDVNSWRPSPTLRAKTDSDSCFVATRLFGRTSIEVASLQQFRDDTLKQIYPGKVFITLYRRIGPSLAKIPGRSFLLPVLRKLIRLFVSLLRY